MRLRGRTTILESWPSQKVADRGTVRLRGELIDDTGEAVMTVLGRGHMRRREAS
jgi:acyl dehydratase